MKNINFEVPEGKTLRELLSDLSEEEYIEAEKNFERFVTLAFEVFERNYKKNANLTNTKNQL